MTFEELKTELKKYIDELSGDDPTDKDIKILEMLEDYTEPEGISEEAIADRINAAITENDAGWRKKFKDRFYGRDDQEEPETGTEPEVVDNEPEEETFKSVLDYEW